MPVEDWADRPEDHRYLWLDQSYSLRVPDGSAPSNPREPHIVAVLRGKGGGRNVFRNMIPAVKFTDAGPGGRSHAIRQQTA